MVGSDELYMTRALFHAARGQGTTAPNPMVGAVVLDADGMVVGQGWHRQAGEPHAEVNALDEAGARARGGTLYVTLEPCCHVGRTGPCTRRVAAAGVARVVVAMQDPDPRVSGRGLDELRAAGITVSVGPCDAAARRLNDAFVKVQTDGRPLVVLKAAASIDGRIGERGRRTHLTSPDADRKTQQLRASLDAIGVGSETLLIDDPLLTSRDTKRIRPLVRVVFDRGLRTPPEARVFSTLADGPVVIATTPERMAEAADRVSALERAGATVRAACDVSAAVRSLLDWGVTTLLVEGGAQMHAALWRAGLVDRLHLIVTPRALGARALPLFDGYRVARSRLDIVTVEPRGADIWIEADVHRNH